MPNNYELIPVAVEAIEITPDTVHRAALWCGGREAEEIHPETEERTVGLNVPTLKGVERASQGSYVVKDLNGGFSVKSANEFKREYRAI
jgi:hypothetical protein